MDHIAILENHQDGNGEYAGKKLVSRALGKFFTPPEIAEPLISSVTKHLPPDVDEVIRVIDPFAGDGRLVEHLIRIATQRYHYLRSAMWKVALWELDEEALRQGISRLRSLEEELSLTVELEVEREDTFRWGPRRFGDFDVVVTNPPWEVLKPDRRELRELAKGEEQQYLNALRSRDDLLAELYPISQPKPKFSGWGTNLSRCGTEVALRLAKPGGVCGVVAPASLLGDHVSRRLRKWIFQNHQVAEVAFFPAEARLFDGVDQPSITFVAVSGGQPNSEASLRIHGPDGNHAHTSDLSINVRELESDDYVLPVHFGAAPFEILSRLSEFPRFSVLEAEAGLWAGRELDETGYKEWTRKEGQYPFAKGRMINRYEIVEDPSRYVTEEVRSIPSTAEHLRVAWRDVSRPTQRRRMKATLIPGGWVTGNSLSVTYFQDGDEERLKALLAIMNSFVFEFQIRAYLATAHLSLGTVRKGRIAGLEDSDLVSRLATLAAQRLEGDLTAERELEVTVAQAYGLDSDVFERVLASFPKITEEERSRFLASELW